MRVPVYVGATARATGFVAVIAIGIAAILNAVRHESAPASKDTVGTNASDSIAAELMRCQNIGLAAQDDRSCVAACAENRRRFFGTEPPVTSPAGTPDGMPSQQPDR